MGSDQEQEQLHNYEQAQAKGCDGGHIKLVQNLKIFVHR